MQAGCCALSPPDTPPEFSSCARVPAHVLQYTKWGQLIEKMATHLQHRYPGKKMMFEVWVRADAHVLGCCKSRSYHY